MEKEIQLADKESSSMTLMKHWASNDETQLDMELDGDALLNRTKLFLVAQARNSLNRIIKLTTFMEKLESRFMMAVDEQLEDTPNNLTLLTLAMETISKCLEDANATVTQVLKDEKLQQIVISTTNIITPDGSSATVIDADSRDAVRNLAASLLSQLSDTYGEDNK